ncbi:hypothetical protein [Variovorax rhizosphaerae]|uniref:Transposase n=1 Tax=Variovorax rhizosphaerae TaxID=1836200 RepID=A0ABU8WQQ6_9BURK
MELDKDGGARARKHRVDWRTGKTMVERGDAFWQEHERLRLESGMSVPQYCEAHELALSTYRHRVSGRRRGGNAVATGTTATTATTKQPISFVALRAPAAPKAAASVAQEAESLEISLGGMTLRLNGKAADRVLERVMARLA